MHIIAKHRQLMPALCDEVADGHDEADPEVELRIMPPTVRYLHLANEPIVPTFMPDGIMSKPQWNL